MSDILEEGRLAGWKRQIEERRTINVGSIERWGSLVAGGVLAGIGLSQGTKKGAALALVGGALMFRGATGFCPVYSALGMDTSSEPQGAESASVPYGQGVRIEKSITIDRPPAELFAFWRKLENLPLFMEQVESVRQIDSKRAHWVGKGPGGVRVGWDEEIINEIPNELIAWRTLEGSDIHHAGSVQFKPVGGGTRVKIEMEYDPPGGKLAAVFAKLFGEEPGQELAEDLRRLKRIMEPGK